MTGVSAALAASSAGAADPLAALLALLAGGPAAMWTPWNLSTLWQNSAGTTPVTSHNDPVRRMDDISGNGFHLTAPSDAARPLYKTDGTLHWLEADGVDDYMATSAINLSAADALTFCVGLRKLSDAGTALFAELSANTNVNAGAFYLAAPYSSTIDFGAYARGSVAPASPLFVDAAPYAAPYSAVATLESDISSDLAQLRLNGSVAGTQSGDMGSGNFGNHALYLFGRGSSSLPCNARFYGGFIAGQQGSGLTTAGEAFLAGKAGVSW